MATPKQLVSNLANISPGSIQVFYTDDGADNGTIIDAFTASNTSTVNASYKAYITTSSGTTANPQQPFQVVVWGDFDLGSGVVNQLIPPGGTLSMESSAADSIYFTVSGKKV